jgi:hypothetical protein
MSEISYADFLAHGYKIFGLPFRDALEGLHTSLHTGRFELPARRRQRSARRPASTASACRVAGEQFAAYLESERIAARTLVALEAVTPPFSPRTAAALLWRTISRFQPSRDGLTIRPRG